MHRLIWLWAIMTCSFAFAQGGPPLVTDDPGTPGDGHWEINVAAQWVPTNTGSTFQFPLVDANYGWGDHIQINVVAGWVNALDYELGPTSGASTISTAVKWRFLDEENCGAAVSLYPRIDSFFPFSSKNTLINEPGTRYFLPIELSKTIGRFGINPEIGYADYTRAPDEWDYGVAVSFEFEKDRELLFELHGRSPNGDNGQELLWDVGTRYAFAEFISFIGAVGHTLRTMKDESAFWNIYSGVQLRY